jgi:glycosyltransferase involved in cell wall biosynthesis
MLKKIARKSRVGAKVLREQGVLGFAIVGLQFIQKKYPRPSRTQQGVKASLNKTGIYTKANYEEIISADLSAPLPKWPGTTKRNLTLNWLMPPPGKGSGGHMTLFRFIKFAEEAGHTCRIYLHNPGVGSNVAEVRAIMGDSFPAVKAEMSWLFPNQKMAPADAVFATSWETAYTVRAAGLEAKHFYFVQDFEPYFYPVGSLSVLAENTYKMGYYGVTAGGWLSTKLKRDYGMQTDNFTFGSGGDIYRHENTTAKRTEINCYVRPYTERRGFELAIMALDIFHRKHPEYTINLFGWDVSQYDIPFPFKNLNILEHHQLNELYNRSAASLVLSLTNMSLLPLELLSCGCIPVVNEGENNTLVSDNSYVAYSKNDPLSLATKLSEIVTNHDQLAYAQEAAASVQTTTWEESGKRFVNIIEREIRKSDA